MPIYHYVCGACGHDLEALQKVSDDPLTDCPSCGKPALRKQITAAAFRLKGTGWYETDFKNKGKKPEERKGGEKKQEGAKSDTKSGAGSASGDTSGVAAGNKAGEK